MQGGKDGALCHLVKTILLNYYKAYTLKLSRVCPKYATRCRDTQ